MGSIAHAILGTVLRNCFDPCRGWIQRQMLEKRENVFLSYKMKTTNRLSPLLSLFPLSASMTSRQFLLLSALPPASPPLPTAAFSAVMTK